MAMITDPFPPEHRIAAAYLLDRAEQYQDGTGIRAALDEVAHAINAGEHLKSALAGELDVLMARLAKVAP
jgi:hypothetical protein